MIEWRRVKGGIVGVRDKMIEIKEEDGGGKGRTPKRQKDMTLSEYHLTMSCVFISTFAMNGWDIEEARLILPSLALSFSIICIVNSS